ncbi:MAG: hypothetical protein Q9P14_06315 [candidate division KSB1 bacterium]|nr:hypothetical protein [candidate division KSB1 bacterium]
MKPKLYFAVGISGAPGTHRRHEGCGTDHRHQYRDPEAPIFEVAHFGVTEDLFDVVPADRG